MSTNSAHVERLVLRNLRYAHSLFRGLLVFLLVVIFSTAYVITGFRVDGHSMDPTLHDGQLLAVNLAAYWFNKPQVGDVVIVQYEGDHEVRFVKRITAGPGGQGQMNSGVIVLQEGEYFVVGDNRDHSTDSRVYGAIKKEQILGKVLGAPPFIEE